MGVLSAFPYLLFLAEIDELLVAKASKPTDKSKR